MSLSFLKFRLFNNNNEEKKSMFPILKFLFLFLILKNLNAEETNEFNVDHGDIRCEMEKNCNLPFCNCDSPDLSLSVLKKYPTFRLPQLVVLTIDDDNLDIKSYQVYKKLLEDFKNPNGCPIKATFFLSDTNNHTSFCLVRNLYDQRNEIAISTVNYTCPNKRCSPLKNFMPWDYEVWSDQILNMRLRLNKYSGIPKAEITGFRAPILEPAADMHFRIISSNKFLYDSSIIVNNDDIVWPFTLDYSIRSPISNNGPISFYPHLWELPIATYLDLSNKRENCLKISEGHCQFDKSVNGISKFLRHHFFRSYYRKRAPVMIQLDGEWLKQYTVTKQTEIIPNVGSTSNNEKAKVDIEMKEYKNLDGVIKFINETLTFNKDVYFVTAQQAIEWMKLMPRLNNQTKALNLTKFLDEELFSECNNGAKFDGSCDALKQLTPDYDEDQTIYLDDNFGELLKKKLRISRSAESVLTNLQTEVLFVNKVVIYFIFILIILLIVIILHDRLF